MSRKKLPPLTVAAVREELEKRDSDDPTRDAAWSDLPILILCEASPARAPQIIDRVLRADGPARLADALRTDGKLLRRVIKLLCTRSREWMDLRDGLAMFEEAQWIKKDQEEYGEKPGKGRRTNFFALQKDKETASEIRLLRDALISDEDPPSRYPEVEFKKQSAEIKRRTAALARIKGKLWEADYKKARKKLKIEAHKRAAIVWLDAVRLPCTEADAAKLLARLKKADQAYRRYGLPLHLRRPPGETTPD